jgi:hypothetical protein
MVRRWALYKAQQSACHLELKQLQASISLSSTVKMIGSLRSFGKMKIGLVPMWCFYYLGSQACKSEHALANSRPFRILPLAWLRMNIPSTLTTAQGNNPTFYSTMNVQEKNERLISKFHYSLVWTRKEVKPCDVAGNPMVPVI